MVLAYILAIATLVLLLCNYRTGIITTLMVLINFGEFIYVNPNLEIGDFGGIGTIYFMDLFWTAMVITIVLKGDKLYLVNYKLSLIILLLLSVISLLIPFMISSFSPKDAISVMRPLGNFLLLPYLVITVTNMRMFNYFEKIVTSLFIIFICIQMYEYFLQSRIPFRLFDQNSLFFGEGDFAVEFGGIKTGYIWPRIACLLPLGLFFGGYYFFTEKRNYGIFLLGTYLLSIMVTLSRIWIIGLGFFLIVMSLFVLLGTGRNKVIRFRLLTLISSIGFVGLILLFTSPVFSSIFDIFLLRVDSISGLADRTDSSFIGREYILIQMIGVWMEYPLFGAGFSTISRRLITNDLGFSNILTIFGGAGIAMFLIFMKQYFSNIMPFIKDYYILFATLASIMLMISFMSLFSIDLFYFNATGAIIFALGNILLNIGKQQSAENVDYINAA